MRPSLRGLALVCASLAIGCGGDDDGGGQGDGGPGDGDGGGGGDGRALTCADLDYQTSGVACGESCQPVFCPCPETFATSVADCTEDGCLTAGDCEVMCAMSLEQAVTCSDTYTTWSEDWVLPVDGDETGGNDAVVAVGALPGGGALLVGTFEGELDLGGGHVLAATEGVSDLFIAHLDAEGQATEAIAFPEVLLQTSAVGPGGRVLLSGHAYGTNFGGGAIDGLFVAELTAGGGHVFSTQLTGHVTPIQVYDIAARPGGGAVVVGTLNDDVDLGGDPIEFGGNGDGFILAVTATGAHDWSLGTGGAGREWVKLVAIAPDGTVYAGGSCEGTIQVGDPLECAASFDPWVASFTAGGAPRWSKAFADGAGHVTALVADDGGVTAGGSMTTGLDFGGGPLPYTDMSDGWIARFAAGGGDHVASLGFGSAESYDQPTRLVLDGGGLAVVGRISGRAAFGALGIRAQGESDLFVALLSADWTVTRVRTFADADRDLRYSLARTTDGRLLVAGTFQGSVDFGAGPTAADSNDGFALSLAE